MFLESSRIPQDTTLEFDICICGGGTAGLALALDLIGSGLRTCVLESGGLRPERRVQDLYAGRNVSRVYDDDGGSFRDYLRSSRSRFLGGSSNCWGGWCRPYDELDFLARPWVPHSGWPLALQDLTPYYQRAQQVLKLGPFAYDAAYWRQAIRSGRFQEFPFDPRRVTTQISQFSPPVRFGRDYREALARAADVTVVLHANAVDLELDPATRRVARVQARHLDGPAFAVRARQVVLAAGGVENARLLLASDRQQAGGLGNEHDLVGRYFMEHGIVPSGPVVFKRPIAGMEAYDATHFFRNARLSSGGVSAAAHLAIPPEVQREHEILNSRTYFGSVFAGDGTATVESLQNFYRWASRLYRHRAPGLGDVGRCLLHPYQAGRAILARVTRAPAFVSGYRMEHVVEPCPNPDSRVTLDRETDRLGMRRAVLDWRPTDQQRHTISVVRRLIGAELRRAGLGEVDEWEPPAPSWMGKMQWCWHHMGTTRMHEDPRHGVVDARCRVHSVPNLYVAGSSVFPTAGPDAPTLTIVALALRLGEHLRQRARAPD